MTEERVVRVGVAVILFDRQERLLIGLRQGKRGAGTWGLPGGYIEVGERPDYAARRELCEETGIRAVEAWPYAHLPWVSTLFDDGSQCITLFFQARALDLEARVMEPEKCAAWEWHPAHQLPSPLFQPLAASHAWIRP